MPGSTRSTRRCAPSSRRLGTMVAALGEASAQKFGQVDQSLRTHAEITEHLSESARSLREALVSPTARGQWGERMAEDVLRLAGFVENVNYVKQTQVEGGTGRPDFTFPLPKGHELYMDVKFPMAGYLRYLEAPTEAERQAHRTAFLRDVRLRVKELAQARLRPRQRPSDGRLRLVVPSQRAAHRVHPRARPGIARRCPRPACRDVLAAHPVRVPRCHPPGLRQLHGRADERPDPRSDQQVRPAMAEVQRGRSTR